MSHDARVFDEAFDAAEGFGEGEKFDALEHRLGRIEPAFQENGDHAAESVHLALGDRVAGMGFEARIGDARDRRMRLQPFAERHGVRR